MMNDFQFDNNEIIGNWECDECAFSYRSAISERLAQCPQCGAPGESFSFWSDVEETVDDSDVLEEEEIVEAFEETDEEDY